MLKKSIVLICVYSCISKVVSFNIETDNVLQKHGDAGSLFGFSIALHQQLTPTKKNLLLVGAPQSKQQNYENVTGVVYKCDLREASQPCQPILFNHEEFLESKGINEQWMGVRVTSQGPGRNVMMCAHRYREWVPRVYVPHLLTGQCYLLGDDLQAQGEDRTFRRVVCDSQHLLSRNMDHEWFAYCQQGHGATFAKDNSSVIFGAPGAYQWKGIVRMEPVDNVDIDSEDPRETGDIDQFNHRLIPLQRSSYLGFSIDTGMALVKKGELTVVSGAPRGGYSGQVTFLKADPDARRNLSVQFLLSGPGLASSFGYDLAVVDFNGDGWDDLAVGAPQYFVKDGEVGGAVYVYINNEGTNWEKINPVQLLGKKDSMFGLAVGNIGDINQDGFGDIAVGAPYENSGRVYIYCGSAKGINKKAAQVISPGSSKVSLFGYSLSGNLDVDDNHYPDLAVGALSGSVYVYRTKPVVSVSVSLKVTPNSIDITKEQCQKQTCNFAAKACFKYTAYPETFNPKLVVNYTFEVDSERRKARLSPRMDFLGQNKGQLELPAQNGEICTDTRLKLVREIVDKLHRIPISVTFSLLSSSPSSRTGSLSPVLNLYQQKKAVSEITLINAGCGSDNICQSQLAVKYKFCSRDKQQSKGQAFTSLHREDGIATITPSDEDIALEITATNRNGDDAHQSDLSITLPDTLHYSTVVYHTQSEKSPVSCTANDKGTLISCELGNPLQRDDEVTFYVILATSGISLSTNHVNVTLQLKTTSEQVIPPIEAIARVVFELKLEVNGLVKPSQVSMGESWKGESAINSVKEIGTPAQYEFRITNVGRPLKSFANISLNILWPKENAVGKWLLYLTQVSSKGVQQIPCSPGAEINPLKHIKGWSDIKRKKRQVEGEIEPLSTEDIFLSLKRTHKTLTCSDGLRCVEIRCPLQGLDSNALIVLHSYLWNTTFTEDYSSLNYLEIVVDASLSLTHSPENIGLISEESTAKVKLTVFLEKKVKYLTKVAWWIILLTVIALLLLLGFGAFIMWKYGPAHCCCASKKPNDEGVKTETENLKL